MPDIVTFDPVNLRIVEIDTGGDNELEWREVYSEWKDWLLADPQRRGLPQAFRVVGGDEISDTENLGSTFFLLEPWKFRPAETDHQLVVSGNLFSDPPTWDRYEPTLGGFTVLFVQKVSTLVEQVGGTDLTVVVDSLATIEGKIDACCDGLGGGGGTPGTSVCDGTATVIPNVYVGHKGDTYVLPVYRGLSPIPSTELASATNLSLRFENEDTNTKVTLSANIAVDGSTLTYTTTDGDGVLEDAGRWIVQGFGDSTGGEPFRSQVIRIRVEIPVAP